MEATCSSDTPVDFKSQKIELFVTTAVRPQILYERILFSKLSEKMEENKYVKLKINTEIVELVTSTKLRLK
jgi:hypothetical protein